MIKLSLLVFLFTIIATGYPQEVGKSLLEPPSNKHNTGSSKLLWLQQLQGLRRYRKPCRRRSNSNLDGAWIPTYSPITHPLYEPTVLQPQALKNEEYRESQVGAATDNDRQTLDTGRRSHDLTTDDDCGDQLGAVKVGSSSEPNAEKTALKIIEDCLKKKQNNQQPLGSSRRSMSDPDSIYNEENNNYPPDSETNDLIDGNKVDDTEAIERRGSFNILPEEGTGLISSGQYGNDLSNLRICYACSTATNPTCWEPDKRTTIKYCRKEHSCVTKSFGVKNQVTLIRDCANSCTDTSVPGIEPKYKSCKICHNDYCNSAMGISINAYHLVIVIIIGIVKYAY